MSLMTEQALASSMVIIDGVTMLVQMVVNVPRLVPNRLPVSQNAILS